MARNIVLLEVAPVVRIQGVVSREIARPAANLFGRDNKKKKHLLIGKIKGDNGKVPQYHILQIIVKYLLVVYTTM